MMTTNFSTGHLVAAAVAVALVVLVAGWAWRRLTRPPYLYEFTRRERREMRYGPQRRPRRGRPVNRGNQQQLRGMYQLRQDEDNRLYGENKTWRPWW